MTTWTDATTNSANWQTATISEGNSVAMNNIFPMNADYLTMNGYYILNETDWADVATNQTVWS